MISRIVVSIPEVAATVETGTDGEVAFVKIGHEKGLPCGRQYVILCAMLSNVILSVIIICWSGTQVSPIWDSYGVTYQRVDDLVCQTVTEEPAPVLDHGWLDRALIQYCIEIPDKCSTNDFYENGIGDGL